MGPITPQSEQWLRLLLALCAAHLIADFPLQPRSWVEAKARRGWRSGHLYLHAAIAGFLSWLFVRQLQAWWILVVVALGHAGIDALKARFRRDRAWLFLADQIAHVGLVVLVAGVLARSGVSLSPPGIRTWAVVNAMLLVWWFEGALIAKATRSWRAKLDEPAGDSRGLPDAGLWIGRLERALVLVFVLIGRYEGIGFLIAAKSIFRFGELTRPEQRREAEYILVGTMASVLMALLTGLGVRALS